VRAFPDSLAGVLEVAGGIAAFCLPKAPFNQATGLGLMGPVTPSDIDALEAFFIARDERVRVNVCPFAHESLPAELSRRGYRVAEFENVLVRALEPGELLPEPDPAIIVRVAAAGDRLEWARAVVLGFMEVGPLSEADERLACAIAAQEGTVALLAFAEGEPVATAELVIGDGLGWLSADTTLPAYRGRGIQTTLQQARLQMAQQAGCDLAVSESRPGSTSQRNMERLGFHIAYTRVDMVQMSA
jgi:GNAT superfamily N-acetyltransferase